MADPITDTMRNVLGGSEAVADLMEQGRELAKALSDVTDEDIDAAKARVLADDAA